MEQSENISRRSFVKGSVVAVSSGVLAGCAPKAVSETPEAGVQAVQESVSGPDVMDSAMAAKKWSFEIAPDPISESDITETVEADVIVVGSGTAGLVCANSAVENGAQVVLISASKGNIARGGSNHVLYSKFMKKLGIEAVDVNKFFRSELTKSGYCVDQAKWWKYAKNGEEAMNWLIDKMEAAGYETVLENPGYVEDGPMNVPLGSHGWTNNEMKKAGMGQQFVVDTLAETASAAGVQIIYQMVAKQLVREDNNTGRVSAVVAQDESGVYHKYVGKKAIVLATGDFSADKEMMAKYCPQMLPYLDDTGSQGYDTGFKFNGLYHGDGQKMGLWIGAAWQKSPNAPMVLGGAGPSNKKLAGHPGLLINRDGERYGNEETALAYTAQAQMQQPEGKAFAIWGTNFAEDAAPWNNNSNYGDEPVSPDTILAGWEDAVESGRMVKGDSIEDVIDALGLPLEKTKATIERYNELCEKGEDEDFFKHSDLLIPLSEGPFYGQVSSGLDLLTVMGGLRTNVNMQVCDENDQPIEGLYNLGTMVGGYYANIYNFLVEGNNLGANCVTFGYLTGRDIALS